MAVEVVDADADVDVAADLRLPRIDDFVDDGFVRLDLVVSDLALLGCTERIANALVRFIFS